MAYEKILYEVKDGIALITLNNPKTLNAISNQMHDEIIDALTKAGKDEDIRVIMFTGAGDRAFSSGAEVQNLAANAEKFKERGATPGIKYIPTPGRSSPIPCWMWENVDKPTIAAVNGVVAGMGGVIAYACDIRIASEKARFAHIYNRRALVCSGETWFLPRFMGLAPAMAHILLADETSAEEALRYNMVYKVVPHEKLMEESMAVARKLADGPRVALKFSRKAIYKGLNLDLLDAMEWVGYFRAMAGYAGEFEEGSKAFLEKRKPQF